MWFLVLDLLKHLDRMGIKVFPFSNYEALLRQRLWILCKVFFHYSNFPCMINETLLFWFLKLTILNFFADFRPISLCTFTYKIISKLWANRLKKWLPCVITYNQAAFVPNQSIHENVFMVHEALHSLKNKRRGRWRAFALKLNIHKAYDYVDWSFLVQIMRKMGFAQQWINWIYFCISTVQYSVVINGHWGSKFTPSRGLRQGDPLSPYLFLLVSDVLSHLLSHAL